MAKLGREMLSDQFRVRRPDNGRDAIVAWVKTKSFEFPLDTQPF